MNNMDSDLPVYKKATLQSVVYRQMRTAVQDVLERFALTTTEWMVLGVLYEAATGLRITDIARSLEVEVPLITRLSKTLKRAGLIQAKRQGHDKRSRPVELTKQGRVVISDVEEQLGERISTLERRADDQTVGDYFRALQLLTHDTSGS